MASRYFALRWSGWPLATSIALALGCSSPTSPSLPAPPGESAAADAGASQGPITANGTAEAGMGPSADAAAEADASRQGLSGNGDPTTWPNPMSNANSDAWLVLNHDQIQQMQPRVLVLNFDNDSNDPATLASFGQAMPDVIASEIIAALAEGSRYHGYKDPSAPVFLQYAVARIVDMTDGAVGYNAPLHNSTWLPRRPNPNCSGPDNGQVCRPNTLDYSQLFTATYADAYGFADPTNPSRYLDLCELFQTGTINEVWIYADDGETTGVMDTRIDEFLESKQQYDATGLALQGMFDPGAGNGTFAAADVAAVTSCGLTLRFMGINPYRGPGCMVHAAGHGFESNVVRNVVPYLAANAAHFLNFDLTRLRLPFDRWYQGCDYGASCAQFLTPTSFTWTDSFSGQMGTVAAYDQGCGSVHFPPNATGEYDYADMFAVTTTCEHYALYDGPTGRDLPDRYTSQKATSYSALDPDCGGGWQIYWRQNFPGLGNSAYGLDGKPMKNWWPFLFY